MILIFLGVLKVTKHIEPDFFHIVEGFSQIIYLVGSSGFGYERWTAQSGIVPHIRLTSAFPLQ